MAKRSLRRATIQAQFGDATYYNTGYDKKKGMYTRLLRVPNRMKAKKGQMLKASKNRGSGSSGG